jgi:hypothetical protein
MTDRERRATEAPEEMPEETRERPQVPEEQGRDWADDAAAARSLDDPRILTPHDSAGVPSSAAPEE